MFSVAPYKHRSGLEETLIGHYCGENLPGPQVSEENASMMKVELTSNEEGVKQGFRAKYEFIEKTPSNREW